MHIAYVITPLACPAAIPHPLSTPRSPHSHNNNTASNLARQPNSAVIVFFACSKLGLHYPSLVVHKDHSSSAIRNTFTHVLTQAQRHQHFHTNSIPSHCASLDLLYCFLIIRHFMWPTAILHLFPAFVHCPATNNNKTIKTCMPQTFNIHRSPWLLHFNFTTSGTWPVTFFRLSPLAMCTICMRQE